jgi:hypothetical protein
MILSADAEEIMANNIRIPTKTWGEAFFVDKVSAGSTPVNRGE